MRLRLPELLDAAEITPYALHKQSVGRVSLSTAYRLVRQHGRVANFSAELLDALCDVLHVEPGDLFEREAVRTTRAPAATGRSTEEASRRRAR